ncbi:hypothetical protein [Streptomyces sp. NPDC037389]|uniref:hypothetical protein n=1 Tax=Streptomyces sp. NPDC037389 TaxID=3155369 RepID=UPI0033F294E5
MTKLPPDAELTKLFHLGVSEQEIATRYRASQQGVNRRMKKMGLIRTPLFNRRINALLGGIWDVKTDRTGGDTHHNAYAIRYLKVYLRLRLGDETVSPTERKKADRLIRSLVRENEVIHYDPTNADGWVYPPRLPSDGRRVLRWPEGVPLPEEEDLLRAMDLPEETPEGPSA